MEKIKREEFDLFELLVDEEKYLKTKEFLKERIKRDFSERKKPASLILNLDIVFTTLGGVLLNLFLIGPYVNSAIKIKKEDIFISDFISQNDLRNLFDKILKNFQKIEGIDYGKIRNKISECINEMTEFSVDLNYMAGETISFHDFLRLSIEDPEADEIFKPEIKYGLQFDQIEKRFKEEGKKIEKFFSRHQESDLRPFIKSKTGLNIKQLTQCIGFVGLKPDIDGSVIPVVIDKNYLLGLDDKENYFINAKGTRKALITNKTMTKKSGYLTRKLSLLMIDRFHDNNSKECDTKHFVTYLINNKKKLKMINNRHYYKIDQVSGKKLSEELLTVSENDEFLIGQKIGMLSPITCSGEHVCATCYGRYLSEVNKSINTGLAAVFKLTEPLTQQLLSAKHRATCC